jgi:integrase/recombinase XerC
VTETFDRYLSYLKETDASTHTLSGYRKDLQAFARWYGETCGEELEPEKITSIDLREYQSWMRNVRNLKPNTVNRRMKALKSWLSWCVKEGLAPRLPDFPRGVPEARGAPEALDRAEVNRLLREVEKEGNARDAALVRLMLSCGLRVSEAVSLRLEDVDIGERRGVITVRSGKGGKYREVPVPPAARKALREWLAVRGKKHPRSPWLFPGVADEKHLTPGAAWRVVKKYAWKARIPDLHPHTLRHTCATNMLRAGANLVEVASVLGHARLDTTAVYTKPSMAELARAAERGEV